MLSDAYLARRNASRGEFYGLLLLVIAGMIGMVQSTDVIAFFVSFELMSLPTYVLAGYIWRDERSGEAVDEVLHQRRLLLGHPGLRPRARVRRDRADVLRRHLRSACTRCRA